MEKLLSLIKEAQKHYDVSIKYIRMDGHELNPGLSFANSKSVVINRLYIEHPHPIYTEDMLIGVLFHELGHIKHFQEGFTKEDLKDDKYRAESELRAFKQSLFETKLLAEHGDIGPLVTVVNEISERQASGKEEDGYQYALNRIVVSSLWADCHELLKQHHRKSN